MPDWMGVADIAAVLWFLGLWTGYTWYADKSSAHERSITAAMNKRRLAWMMQALNRDLRIVDTNILGNLLTGVGFFASTTIFVLGGLMAMLGVAEQGTAALARLPFASTVQETIWEVKILFLLLIFIYAFFKFTWAFRLANYCSITVGTMPNSDRSSHHGGHPHSPVRPPFQSRPEGLFLCPRRPGLVDQPVGLCDDDRSRGMDPLPQRILIPRRTRSARYDGEKSLASERLRIEIRPQNPHNEGRTCAEGLNLIVLAVKNPI
jgi:hypothetical protein